MNSGDRLALAVSQVYRASELRVLSVLAGLMVEALDVRKIVVPVKSKFNCLSLLSRTFQEDPSCQLSVVLHRYALLQHTDWASLEGRLSPPVLPPLPTLKQGVVVLSRQWKNALYTPFMLTFGLRQTRAPKATSAAPASASAVPRAKERQPSVVFKEGVEAGDEEERTLLLTNNDTESPWISSNDSSTIFSPADLNASLPLLGSSQLASPPTLSDLKRKIYKTPGLSDSYELKTLSPSSGDDVGAGGAGGTGGGGGGGGGNEAEDEESIDRDYRKSENEEDLYSWVARQQQRVPMKSDRVSPAGEVRDRIGNVAESSGAGATDLPLHQPNLLVDTRVIFAPLLASVGLESKRTISELLSLSGSASVLGGIEELRVEIFESEWNSQTSTRRRAKTGCYRSRNGIGGGGVGGGGGGSKFTVFIPPDVPAFLCERMSIEVEVKQISDGRPRFARVAGFLGPASLKPQRTTALNFSLSVGYIAQQVNMPLLRLLHQLSSVYVNAKTTQVQLREQRPPKRGVDHLRALAVILDSTVSTPSPQVRLDPSPSVLSDPTNFALRSFRPSSLAQRLRSGTKLGKGFSSMDEPLLVLTTANQTMPATGTSPAAANGATRLPNCWKTIYHLLDLYASMTAASTVNKQHSFADPAATAGAVADVEMGLPSSMANRNSVSSGNTERIRLVVFGIMKINRVRLLAMLSGLRLESEIVSLHSSLTYKEKVRSLAMGPTVGLALPATAGAVAPRVECSLTGHLGKAMIVLLEGVAPSQQTVVKITVGKSQALYSTLSHHSKDKNSGLLSVGAVLVDIPQHPVVLHGMMTRGSKQLSSTLQEFRVPRLATSSRTGRNTSTIPDETDATANASLLNAAGHSLQSPPKETPPVPDEGLANAANAVQGNAPSLLQPLVMQFSIVLQRLSVTAALLPSLEAQYQMEHVVSAGVTGSKAKFTVDLPRHSLSFTTKLQITENLPPSASIELPQVHVGAEYLQDSATTEEFVDGVVLCRGNYLSAVAEIGTFEHCLTTDLLNHLVFVQKVFMTEVNDVLMKVSGGDKPVPLWEESTVQPSSTSLRLLLYNLIVRLKGIQITATTPTNTAVRLETGLVELQLSNRVQNVSGSKSHMSRARAGRGPASAGPNSQTGTTSRPAKLFGRAKVDLNLSLGQLIRNPLFEEAEPEFQQVAFFKTRISLRNAFQDELTPIEGGGDAADKEVHSFTSQIFTKLSIKPF